MDSSEFELSMRSRGWVIGDTQILFGFVAIRVIAPAGEMELLNLAVGPNWRAVVRLHPPEHRSRGLSRQ